jgi:mannose-6-phosphate isomerase-like protein (cupin superfamily)
MESSTPREAPEPRALTIRGFKFNGVDRYVPGCRYTEIAEGEGFGEFGLYFMPPGAQTTVFSLESGDDGTADEYYGPRFEFYYLLSGEITMYWGTDAESLRRGEGERLLLGAGDFGCWEREWKFSARNSGEVPATFFWGLAEAPPDVAERLPVLQTREGLPDTGPA